MAAAAGREQWVKPTGGGCRFAPGERGLAHIADPVCHRPQLTGGKAVRQIGPPPR
jgi:hypothetical protein